MAQHPQVQWTLYISGHDSVQCPPCVQLRGRNQKGEVGVALLTTAWVPQVVLTLRGAATSDTGRTLLCPKVSGQLVTPRSLGEEPGRRGRPSPQGVPCYHLASK